MCGGKHDQLVGLQCTNKELYLSLLHALMDSNNGTKDSIPHLRNVQRISKTHQKKCAASDAFLELFVFSMRRLLQAWVHRVVDKRDILQIHKFQHSAVHFYRFCSLGYIFQSYHHIRSLRAQWALLILMRRRVLNTVISHANVAAIEQ